LCVILEFFPFLLSFNVFELFLLKEFPTGFHPIKQAVVRRLSHSCRSYGLVQRLVQVGDNIDGMLGPHTEAHHVRRDVCQRPPLIPLLLMG